jgi:hypothetical protein
VEITMSNLPEAALSRGETKFTVTVVYNGVAKPLEVNAHQAIQAVLVHALQLFGLVPGGEPMVLAAAAGELHPNQSVESAGIKAGAQLLLRPRTVRGG